MNDSISRQAALDHLRKRLFETANNNVGYRCDAGRVFADAADRVHGWLDEIPCARELPAQQWTPVTEGLPKNSEPVLVTLADGEVTTDEYWGDAVNTEDEGWGLSMIGIVAWMPLPEPYEEEQ